MNVNKFFKSGDILYKVDPKKLSVNIFVIENRETKGNSAPTNYEDFSFEKSERKQIPSSVKEFPFEFGGVLFFLTEDEANIYIKMQIGM